MQHSSSAVDHVINNSFITRQTKKQSEKYIAKEQFNQAIQESKKYISKNNLTNQYKTFLKPAQILILLLLIWNQYIRVFLLQQIITKKKNVKPPTGHPWLIRP